MAKDTFGNNDIALVKQHQETTATYGQMALGFFKSVGHTVVIGTFIDGVSATPSSSPSPSPSPSPTNHDNDIGEAGVALSVFLAVGFISLAAVACFFMCRKKYCENKTVDDEETSLTTNYWPSDNKGNSNKNLPCSHSH
jgi:hypothetical protein